MINKYESIIINKLLDKYENSKSFIGDNKVSQSFSVKVSSLFPKYLDHANFELFQEVNEAVDILTRMGIVSSKANNANVHNNIVLNLENLDNAYVYIGRNSKQELNQLIERILCKYKDKNEILSIYCNKQLERLRMNKSVQYFSGDINEFENILMAIDQLFKVENETFVRDFSVKVFISSKTFDMIISKVVGLLFEFGDFPEKEDVLGNLNIVKNPTYVNFKGAGIVSIGEQAIDLNKLNGDIAISSSLISSINDIKVTGTAVITIENLTSFNTFKDDTMLAIYLGGFHNKVRRDFIKKVYSQNNNIDFFHFGDIDAGGLYILEHLKRETGVDFKPYKMDIDTIKMYAEFTRPLTENDRARLLKLTNSEYNKVVLYMLENNCKLEQEAIGIK